MKLTSYLIVLVLTVTMTTGCPDKKSKKKSNTTTTTNNTDPTPTPTPAASTVSGKASAPAGVVAQFENNPFALVLAEFFMSSASAGLSGLQPLTGGTVELIRVDNAGAQVDDVLATAIISSTGDYSIELPAGLVLTADLVLRITGNGGASMRAVATSTDVPVNITPISEFVLQKLIAGGTQLASLALNEVVNLTGKVEQFDVIAGNDLAETLAQLEEDAGAFADNQVEVANSNPGDGASVAGNWVNYRFALSPHDGEFAGDGTGPNGGSGSFNVEQSISELSYSDGGSGVVNLTIGAEEDKHSSYDATTPDSQSVSYSLSTETQVEAGGETGQVSINDNGDLIFPGEFEEEIDGEGNDNPADGPEFGFRSFPNTTIFRNTGNGNVLFNTHREIDIRYETIDTNNDGVKDAIDESKKSGDEAFVTLEVQLRKGTSLDQSILMGDYGSLNFNVDLETAFLSDPAISEFTSERGVVNFNGGGVYTALSGALTESWITRTPNTNAFPTVGVSHDSETNVSEHVLAYTVSTTGALQLVDNKGTPETTDDESISGQVSDDGKFYVLTQFIQDEDGETPPSIVSTEQQISFGVKLGTTAPDMSNAVYRLFPLHVGFKPDGLTEYGTFKGDSFLTFNELGTGASLVGGDLGIVRSNDIAQLESETADFPAGAPPFTATIAANGAVMFTNPGPEDLVGNGFVSDDAKVLILQLFSTNAFEAGDGKFLGAVLAIRQ